jgi:hypothetical protein
VETFAECNGRYLEPATRGAGGVDVSTLDVVGMGSVCSAARTNVVVMAMSTITVV